MGLHKVFKVVLGMVVLTLPLQAADVSKFEVYGGFSYLWADVNANPGVNSFQRYYFNESNLMFGDLINTVSLFHSLTNSPGNQPLPGFEISGTYNWKKWLGVEFGYQRHSGEQVIDQNIPYLDYENMGYFIITETATPVSATQGFPVLPTKTEFVIPANSTTSAAGFGTATLTRDTWLAGPKFSWRNKSKFTPFAHVQFGVSQFKRKDFKMKYSIDSEYHEYNVDSSGKNFLTQKQTFSLQGNLTGDFSNVGFAMSFGGGLDWQISKRLSVRLIQADYMPTRNGFNYKYTDGFTSDISDYAYEIVSILQGYSAEGPIYADYNKETRERVIYTGTRAYGYSVPNQFLNNMKVSAGIVFHF
jgi:hypothetical protein